VKLNNAITQIDFQTSVDQCLALGDPGFCNNVQRDANGFIKSVDSIYLNGASYLVSGIDVQAHYTFKPRVFGPDERVNLSVFYNHKFNQEQTPFLGGPVVDQLGKADLYSTSSNPGTGFKDQVTFNAYYQAGQFSLAYTLRYFSPITASNGATIYEVPAYTYHDLQAKFTIGEERNYEFYFGVNNLFDKQPPFIAAGPSQWPGTNTVASTYDLYGRMLYAGIRTKF
jgi:outer membrane receptor protein involved in Fe transport